MSENSGKNKKQKGNFFQSNQPTRKRKKLEDQVDIFQRFKKSNSGHKADEIFHWSINPEIFKISEEESNLTNSILSSKTFAIRQDISAVKHHYTQVTPQGTCLPFYLQTIDYYKNSIWLFGVGQHSERSDTISVALKITDFCPYFYIRLREGENTFKWKAAFMSRCSKADRPILFSEEKYVDKVPFWRHDVHAISFEYLRPLIGFHSPSDGDVWFVAKISCVSQFARSRIVSFLKEQEDEHYHILHEHLTPIQQFITEMLRVPPITLNDPKKFAERTIPHPFGTCRWFQIFRLFLEKEKVTTVQLEAKIRMRDIVAGMENDPQFRTPNSVVLVVDIETIGHGFRFANASNPEDYVACICCAIVVHNSSVPLQGVWFCLGSVLHAGQHEIDGVPIYILCFSTEKEMLSAFITWWQQCDPDAYSSWNGEKYDFPFLLERLKLYQLSTSFGRFKSEQLQSPWTRLQEIGFWMRKTRNNMNKQKPPSIRMSGRVSLDGLPWFPRFAKVENYQLKTVVQTFVKRKKDWKSPPTLTEEQKFEPDTPEWITKVLLDPNRHGKIDLEYYKIGPYAVSSPLHRYALAYYCYFDALYAWRCLRDPNFVDYIYQIRALTSADSHAAQELGQQILVYFRLLQHVSAGHYALNGEDFHELRPENYSGGFCVQPLAGSHTMVIIMDFNSLYPSCIRSYQLSYDTLCLDQEMLKTAKRLGHEIIKSKCDNQIFYWVQMRDRNDTLLADFFRDLFDKRKKHKQLLEIAKQQKDESGIIYHSCTEKGIKLIMNSAYGFEGAATLENTGEVVDRNSSYWPLSGFFPISMATTHFGRENIKKVIKRMLETKETLLIYGDTDSTMTKYLRSIYQKIAQVYQEEWNELRTKFQKAENLNLSVEDEKYQLLKKDMKLLDRRCLTAIYNIADKTRAEITKDLPLTLEVETMFWTFHALQMKKKYCGWSFTKLPEHDVLENGEMVFRFEEKLKIRGLDSERRDVAPFVKRIVLKLIEMLVKPTHEDEQFGLTGFLLHPEHEYIVSRKKKMMSEIANYLHRMTCQLASGAVSIEDLAIGKTLKAEYKKDVAHSYVARRMNERGEKVDVGSKIHIVKVRLKRMKEMYQFEEMEHVRAHHIDIDYEYYLVTILIPILERLLIIPNLFTKQDIKIICNDAIQILPHTLKQARNIETYFSNKKG